MILILALLLQESEEFTKFKPGTTWVYDTDAGTLTLKVTHEEDGRLFLESIEQRKDEREPRKETLTWHVEEGCLLMSEVANRKSRTLFRLYKLGSKKGDAWKTPMGPDEGEFRHLGTEELVVTAGTFRDVIHVRASHAVPAADPPVQVTLDFYLVPKVGIVKMEFGSGKKTSRFELREFSGRP